MSCEQGGITYVIEKKLAESVGVVSVDFVDRGWRTGFVLTSERPLGKSGQQDCGGCEC